MRSLNRHHRIGLVVALLLAAAALALAPLAATDGGDGMTVREAANGSWYAVENMQWTVASVHANDTGVTDGEIFARSTVPPTPVAGSVLFFDGEWAFLGGAIYSMSGVHTDPEARVLAPTGDELHLTGPRLVFSGPPNGSWIAWRWQWRLENRTTDGPALHVVSLTDDDGFANVSVSSGSLGNHTQGPDGVTYQRARNWDRARFYGRATTFGQGYVVDGYEEVHTDRTTIVGMDLTPGEGRAGWSGPGDLGRECFDGPAEVGCEHFDVVQGPAGTYRFSVDYHVPGGVLGADDPWILVGGVEKPE